MKKRQGELSFEGILGIAFLTLLAATMIAVLQFHFARQLGNGIEDDITVSYNSLLKNMRHDTSIASTFECASDSVKLFDSQGQLIAFYKTMNKGLFRFDIAGKGELMINHVENTSFRPHPELKNLIIATVLPVDKMQIPFFTSFALRGSCK